MVTAFKFRSAFEHVKRFKKCCDAKKCPPKHVVEISMGLGHDIIKNSIDTKCLSNQEIMAAIFLVNSVAHHSRKSESEAFAIKDQLQFTLVTRKGIEVRIGRGPFKHCLEIRVRFWTTHIPLTLIEEWKIDLKY